jgi:hypothetical protein
MLTPGNTHDLKPVPRLVKRLSGKLFGDKAYPSQPVFKELLETYGIQLITKLRKNMKNQLMPLTDKLMLRKRAIVETIVDQLKNISQIEHSRHRSDQLLGQCGVWLDCLLSPAQEAFNSPN